MILDKRILLLGHSGKMGTALRETFSDCPDLVCRNSSDFDASDFDQVGTLIEEVQPDIVINTVAFLGIDPCEAEPEKAFRLNILYPRTLAELSRDKGFILIHFSTDAVFSDRESGFYTEADTPRPLNMYGVTKYGGDCVVQSLAERYYIIRIPILFGPKSKNNQFVEKMLGLIDGGLETLRISEDIISSPTYSMDIARQVKRIVLNGLPWGVYHVANQGKASLYELMKEVVANLELDARVERASYKDFPHVGVKNTCTPITSQKIEALRPWKDAVREYCKNLQAIHHGD